MQELVGALQRAYIPDRTPRTGLALNGKPLTIGDIDRISGSIAESPAMSIYRMATGKFIASVTAEELELLVLALPRGTYELTDSNGHHVRYITLR